MLSLPNDGRYPAVELEPQQRRQKTRPYVTALTINRLAQRDIEDHDRSRRREQVASSQYPPGYH
jgi:hypothetical protein